MKNYYEILEVNEKASIDIIKKVFKIKIKESHPDLFQGKEKELAEIRVKELNEAYEILSNTDKRAEYDMILKEQQKLNKTERELELENTINILQMQLQEKDKIIDQFLDKIDLNEYNLQNSSTTNNYDIKKNKNNINYNNSYSNDYNNFSENIFNSKSYEYGTPKYYLHCFKFMLLKILIFILTITLVFFIISKITNVNLFNILFNVFFQ